MLRQIRVIPKPHGSGIPDKQGVVKIALIHPGKFIGACPDDPGIPVNVGGNVVQVLLPCALPKRLQPLKRRMRPVRRLRNAGSRLQACGKQCAALRLGGRVPLCAGIPGLLLISGRLLIRVRLPRPGGFFPPGFRQNLCFLLGKALRPFFWQSRRCLHRLLREKLPGINVIVQSGKQDG